MSGGPVEVSWFGALCDDDYEVLGVEDPALVSSFDHCAAIVDEAERWGFDNILLPSGYTLGIDPVAFASAVARRTERIRLLVAVRSGELWPPQLARQLATLDELLDGRLTVNIISSDLPGESLDPEPRYGRTLEVMEVVRDLLDGRPVDHDGPAYRLRVEPPRLGTVSGWCPPLYFGGLSEPAREVAARAADVYLLWPDTEEAVAALLADSSGPGPPPTAGRCGSATGSTSWCDRPGRRRVPWHAIWWAASTTPWAGPSAAGRWTPARPGWPARPRSGPRPMTRATWNPICGPASAGPDRGAARRSWVIPVRWRPSCSGTSTWGSTPSSCRATRTSTSAGGSVGPYCRCSTTGRSRSDRWPPGRRSAVQHLRAG